MMETTPTTNASRKGIRNFPVVLYTMLQQVEIEGRTDIVSWRPHGRAFLVHKVQEFEEQVLPRFFRHNRFVSFQRQLNIYNFQRFTFGPDQNSYYHELFIRNRPEPILQIRRTVTKAIDDHRAGNSFDPPNFYEGVVNPPSTVSSSLGSSVADIANPTNFTMSSLSTAPSQFQSMVQQNAILEHLLLQSQNQNVGTPGSTSIATSSSSSTIPGFHNANPTMLDVDPLLLMIQQHQQQQLEEQINHLVQPLSLPVHQPINNATSVQDEEISNYMLSLLSSSNTFDYGTQQQLTSNVRLIDNNTILRSRGFNDMNPNDRYPLHPSLYGNNIGLDYSDIMSQLLSNNTVPNPVSGVEEGATRLWTPNDNIQSQQNTSEWSHQPQQQQQVLMDALHNALLMTPQQNLTDALEIALLMNPEQNQSPNDEQILQPPTSNQNENSRSHQNGR